MQRKRVPKRVPSHRLTAARAVALVDRLLAWFRLNARDLPWRRTSDPYAVWISEIMLQQTQVRTVVPYWRRWMRAFPDLRALARARPDRVLKLWEGLGYYRRARHLQAAAQQIVRQHRGRFPERFEDVLALPGIGRYTAGAICSIAFNQPAPVVDGNVIRVLTRVFGIAEDPARKKAAAALWDLAETLVRTAAGRPGRRRPSRSHGANVRAAAGRASRRPADRPCSALNQALMELGALTCTPRDPKCGLCPLKTRCLAFRLGRTDRWPALGKRASVSRRRFLAFVVARNGRFLVRQRPAAAVNGRLWEFPSAEVRDGAAGDALTVAENLLGSVPVSVRLLGRVRHGITRYRITLDVFQADYPPGRSGDPTRGFEGRWCSPAELDRLAFPSAHRRIVRQLHEIPNDE